ncbi:MAG: hypothetical protein IJQ90_04705 [Alphaproteobacteria bacterium]|nr:hypothetical protein [Alphaproteobacteria bacterium]
MKYVKPGPFTTKQFSIEETITETEDVIGIAKDVIKKIPNIPDNIKKELKLALTNLDNAEEYLRYIRKKTDIALQFVPEKIQEQEYL